MRRLGAVLLLVLLVAGMNVRSVWSGGGKWGSGTPSGARTDAYWLPDAQTPTGKPFPDVAIGGTLVTTSLQSASWSLGISDFLADLSPNTASLSFVGQVSGVPGDDVVISTGLGVAWSGRLDTVTQTRDAAGDWWTTITATDRMGALGAATLNAYAIDSYLNLPSPTKTVEDLAETLAIAAGITLDVVDDSGGALSAVEWVGDPSTFSGDTYTGNLLPVVNQAAIATNTMLALTRDGRISAVVRQSVTPSSVLTLSGANAPRSWSLVYSIDVDINKWVVGTSERGRDAADVAIYGERPYPEVTDFLADDMTVFDDWITYGGSQRPTASGDLVVSDFSQSALILLDPFQWVTESGTDWQVLSVQHSVTASPYSWTVSITADNLLDLL